MKAASHNSKTTVQVGNLILGLSGLLIIWSIFLPWEHPRNLFYELINDYKALLASFLKYEWLEVFFYVGKLLVNVAPVILGITLLLGAFLPSGKVNSGACFLHHIHTLGGLACALWIFFGLTFFDREAGSGLRWAFLAGAIVFTILSLAEVALYVKTFKGTGRWGDSIHVLPLVLFLVLAVGGVLLFRNSKEWHVLDYVVIAIGSALGLVGIGIRNAVGVKNSEFRSSVAKPAKLELK